MTSQFAPVTDFKKKNCAPAARFKKISRLRRALKKKNRACGALQKNFAPAARFKKKIIKKPENPIKNRSKLTLTIFDHQKVLETGNWKLESFQFPVLIIFNVINISIYDCYYNKMITTRIITLDFQMLPRMTEERTKL